MNTRDLRINDSIEVNSKINKVCKENACDPFGNILREEFSSGLVVTSSYDDYSRPVQRILPDDSQILYAYEGPFLKTVTRLDSRGSQLYSHTYEEFDEKGNPLFETGLFSTSYSYDKEGRRIFQKNPYFAEEIEYDRSGNLIRKGNIRYAYDAASQLISEESKFQFTYDHHYNRASVNGEEIQIDALNQRRDVEYNPNGNLIREGFVYDEFDQLVQTGTDHFTYDALGRRLINGSTAYFYIEDEEIGSFQNGQIEELKVLGITEPVAIEIRDKPFAPVIDVQNTIRQLVDWNTGEVTFANSCDAFGKGLSADIPYAYVGKRYDVSSGLVYFGKRFYDPSLGRWLTPDPLGAVDHSNLYQYVFNNPFRYYDPKGESIGGYLLGLGEMVLGGAIMVGGLGLEFVTCGGFTLGFIAVESTGAMLIGHGLSLATQHAQNISFDSLNTDRPYVIAKNDPGTPKSNENQNKQFNDAVKEIERKIGKGLSKDQRNKLHRDISGKDYGYHEIIEEGMGLFE